MKKRGRPKLIIDPNPIEPNWLSTKFTREYNHDGVKSVWNFDLTKSTNGPISVEITYPSNYKLVEDENEQLPKTKRKYLNPNNGKYVGFQRAKSLGLIKK
jgi:hypothetical protein